MPRPTPGMGADGLPLWDTFEALFFMVAGLTIGLVLGFLLPSLWRSFRRRFRNTSRFSAKELGIEAVTHPVLVVLSDEGAEEDPARFAATHIAEAFYIARAQAQEGRARESVRIYLEILGHHHVSKNETNKALFELAQVYMMLGLAERAFDLSFELLNRKPKSQRVLELVLQVVYRFQLIHRIPAVVTSFKGTMSPNVRLSIAHIYCRYAEILILQGKDDEALTRARDAIRWDMTAARPKILLWEITSRRFWKQCGDDPKILWIGLATDLEARYQISKESALSASAGAKYLSELITHLSASSQVLESFPTIRSEFENHAKLNPPDPERLQLYETLILMAAVELEKLGQLDRNPMLLRILEILSSNSIPFEKKNNISKVFKQSIQLGLTVHRCSKCGSLSEKHAWECHVCNGRESFQPVTDT